jgi:hypothetical protein
MRAPRPVLPAALLVAVALAGCGLSNPYATHTTASRHGTRSATAPARNADPVPERGGTIPSAARRAQGAVSARAGEATPRAALERYAQLYTNWTAATVLGLQRQLAAISIDSARAEAQQAAASYARDTTLSASHVTNHGTVVGITPGQGPAAGNWVIVTRETTTGTGDYSGLPPQLHVTYAQLTHTGHGWIVSTWSPQS